MISAAISAGEAAVRMDIPDCLRASTLEWVLFLHAKYNRQLLLAVRSFAGNHFDNGKNDILLFIRSAVP